VGAPKTSEKTDSASQPGGAAAASANAGQGSEESADSNQAIPLQKRKLFGLIPIGPSVPVPSAATPAEQIPAQESEPAAPPAQPPDKE
jgi:hypothetical protein